MTLDAKDSSVGILEPTPPRPRYAAQRVAAARLNSINPRMLIQRAHGEGKALRRARSEEREALPKEL